MGKESCNLSIDPELKRKAKNNDINLSQALEQTLEQMVNKSDSKEEQVKDLKKKKNMKEEELIDKESEIKKLKEEIQKLDSQIQRIESEIEAEEKTTSEEERFLRLVDRHTDEANWTKPSDIPIFWVQELNVSDKKELWKKAEKEGIIPEKLKVSA